MDYREEQNRVSGIIEETLKTGCLQINTGIENKRLCYPATPERLTGLLHVVKSGMDYYDKEFPTVEPDDPENQLTLPRNFLSSNYNDMRIFGNINLARMNPEGLARICLPFFRIANKSLFKQFRAHNDYEFGTRVVPTHLMLSYKTIEDKIPESLKPDCKKWFSHVLAYITMTDFNAAMSLEKHQERVFNHAIDHMVEQEVADMFKAFGDN